MIVKKGNNQFETELQSRRILMVVRCCITFHDVVKLSLCSIREAYTDVVVDATATNNTQKACYKCFVKVFHTQPQSTR